MRELEIVAALPGSLRLGEPVTSGPLTLVPVFGGQPGPTYRLAAEAIADGTLSIGEIGGGQVPQLGVHNVGELPVLLVEGEHLQGAMQDRVLNVTVLVPAKADTEIPVSCVEQGRWDYRSGRRFDASPEFSPSSLRAIKTASVSARRRSMGDHRSDQASVWMEVARKHASLGSSSQTGAMRDAYEQRASDLEAMTRSFGRPLPEQTGVVVTIGGRAVAFDGFDKPETLARLWPRLVRGYAMEALGEPERHAERESRRAVRRGDRICEGDRARCRRSRDRGRPDGLGLRRRRARLGRLGGTRRSVRRRFRAIGRERERSRRGSIVVPRSGSQRSLIERGRVGPNARSCQTLLVPLAM